MHFCITKDIEYFLKGTTRYLNSKTEEFFIDLLKGRFNSSSEVRMFLFQVGLAEKELKEKGLFKENPQFRHLDSYSILFADITGLSLDMSKEPILLMGTDITSILSSAPEGTCLYSDSGLVKLPYGECFPLTDWLQLLRHEGLLVLDELISLLEGLEGKRLFLMKLDSSKEQLHTINWHSA